MKKILKLNLLLIILMQSSFVNAQSGHGTNNLTGGHSLNPGEYLVSDNRKYKLTMQETGFLTLVRQDNDRILWIASPISLTSNVERKIMREALKKTNSLGHNPELDQEEKDYIDRIFAAKKFPELVYILNRIKVDKITYNRGRGGPRGNGILKDQLQFLFDSYSGKEIQRGKLADLNPADIPYRPNPLTFPNSSLVMKWEDKFWREARVELRSPVYPGSIGQFKLWGLIMSDIQNPKLLLRNDGNLVLIGDATIGAIPSEGRHFHLMVSHGFYRYGKGEIIGEREEKDHIAWETNTSENEIARLDRLYEQNNRIIIYEDITGGPSHNTTLVTGNLIFRHSSVRKYSHSLTYVAGDYIELQPNFDTDIRNEGHLLLDIARYESQLKNDNSDSGAGNTTLNFLTEASQQTNSKDAIFYPNPTSGELNIKLKNDSDKVLKISVFNLHGVKALDVQDKNTINLSRLPAGVYRVKVSTYLGSFSEKIIKK